MIILSTQIRISQNLFMHVHCRIVKERRGEIFIYNCINWKPDRRVYNYCSEAKASINVGDIS